MVNLFDVDYNVFTPVPTDNPNQITHCNNISYYFTHTITNEPNKLWPFVDYTYFKGVNKYLVLTGFNGIFYQYDITDFLFYMGLILLFLFYKAYIAPQALKNKTQ